jgi:hypothetical protein
MPTPESYFAYADDFFYLSVRAEGLMAPVLARLTPEVIRGGVLTEEVTATLITDDRAAQRVAEECAASADECRRRGVLCWDLREQWRRYREAVVVYGATARPTTDADPPQPLPPPPSPPPAPPSWCQI